MVKFHRETHKEENIRNKTTDIAYESSAARYVHVKVRLMFQLEVYSMSSVYLGESSLFFALKTHL